MRDDVKIGVLLGFLLVVGVFVYWLVNQQPNAGAPGAKPVNLTLAGTSPTPTPAASVRPAAVSPSPRASVRPSAAPIVVDTPAPIALPPRPVPSPVSPPVVSDPPAVLDIPVPLPPVVPPSTVGGSSVPAPAGSATAAYEALEKGTDGVRVYSTKESDTAWVLAQRFYGNGTKWTLIKDANPGVNIEHGMPLGVKIRIPALPAAPVTPVAPGTTPTTPGSPGTTPTALGPNEYVVKDGDNLTKIAQEKLGKGSLWTKIIEANPGLDEKNLPVGKVIKLPPVPAAGTPGTTPTTPTTPTTSTTPAAPVLGPNEYVIQSGDLLSAIAKEKLGKESLWTEILKLNPDLDERNLPVGKVIKLPPKPAASPAPAGGSGDRIRL